MSGPRVRGGRYRAGLRDAITALLPRDSLELLPGDGKTRWTSMLLVLCAILASWSEGPALGDRFDAARRCLVRWYPGRRRPGGCREGFLRALRKRGRRLARVVCERYRGHVRRLAGPRWEVEGWVPIGADSSKIDAPMTAANERGLGTCGKEARPQMLLTVLWHLGAHLPWAFVRGHARSGERRHLLGLLCTLPLNALLLIDAGFTGYDFWKRVGGPGRSFLVRVGSNVKLLRKLGVAHKPGDGDLVWVWPEERRKGRGAPLPLRLIKLVDGRNRAMYLLTNVPDAGRLSDASAARLYKLRWGVEVGFRALKQTLARRKMLGRSPRHARAELTWAVVGLWTLLLVKARRRGLPPTEGVAATLRVLRRAMAGHPTSLGGELGRLKEDKSQRRSSKKARHWPHKKRDKPPGRPKARNATKRERALAKELMEEKIAA